MDKILFQVRKILAVMMIAIFFVEIKTNGKEQHKVLDKEGCRLNAFITSDAHIEGNQPEKLKNFGRMLHDIKNTDVKNDAVVFLGDNTMNGQHIESMLFYAAIKNVSPAKNTIVALGNHDVGNANGQYDELLPRFIDYNSGFFNAEITKPYYYKVINGYYFIVLAPETDDFDVFVFSDEQYNFLEQTLELASKDGKPIFVFSHFPLYRLDDDFYYPVYTLLNQYKNVFYFYGHMHSRIEDYNVSKYRNIKHISVPMFTSVNPDEKEVADRGVGYALEVYDDRVVLRGRNCYDGVWLEDYTFTFSLNDFPIILPPEIIIPIA